MFLKIFKNQICCSPLDSYFNRERVSLEEIHGKYGHNGQVRLINTLSWLKLLFFTHCNIDTLTWFRDTFLRFVRTIATCMAAEGRVIKIRWLFCMLSTNYQMISPNLKIKILTRSGRCPGLPCSPRDARKWSTSISARCSVFSS